MIEPTRAALRRAIEPPAHEAQIDEMIRPGRIWMSSSPAIIGTALVGKPADGGWAIESLEKSA